MRSRLISCLLLHLGYGNSGGRHVVIRTSSARGRAVATRTPVPMRQLLERLSFNVSDEGRTGVGLLRLCSEYVYGTKRTSSIFELYSSIVYA
ncbi:hypothetical protein AVEN_32844-1 [Araneus ventricosus]|uniref:Uncharacterized protein n=1 Tax=Araneus ventricosus TaxID=182803 RepID=A0A4Y2DY95_ARAVE|nr:hypothetical protein AVEN_32844-1 [Araneus ventricosus]